MGLLDLLIVLLLISWLGGVSIHVGGSLIHLLLVIVLAMVIARLARGRHI
jgi:hypothetical protein